MRKFVFILVLLLLFISCRENLIEEDTQTQKAQIPGSLHLSSNPDKAKIFINGTDSGKLTRDSLINLYPGFYNIRLFHDAQRDTTMKIEVISGRSKYIYVYFRVKNI